MRNKPSIYRAPVLFVLLFTFAFLNSLAIAQSADREKPKLKDFGSSLKRIKWDSKRNEAVETKRTDEKGKVEKSSSDIDVVRVETTLVTADVLVVDKQGQSVQGLTRDDFVITEDGKPQLVGSFSLGDNATVPRSIVLIIDYSGSQFPFIKTSVEAAKILVDKLAPNDRMAIVTDDVELLQDFTQDKEKLKKRLDSLVIRVGNYFDRGRRFGRSNQYSALMATLKEAFSEEDQRPIIIFQTDGDQLGYLRNPIISLSIPPNLLPPDMQKEQERMIAHMQRYERDRMTEFSLSDIYKAAEKSRATIYTIIPGFQLLGLTPDQQLEQIKAYSEKNLSVWVKPEDRKRVRERMEERTKRMPIEATKYGVEQLLKMQSALVGVAKITGGWADFLEDASQAPEIYARIFSDINRRYIVGYYPANKEHDGKRRKLDIEVKGHPEYMVLGRKSYYAPGPEN